MRRMTLLTPPDLRSQALKRSRFAAGQRRHPQACEPLSAAWFDLLLTALSIPAAALRAQRGAAPRVAVDDELDDVDWEGDGGDGDAAAHGVRADPSSGDWLFWSFLMCMAIAALPLVGIRWTTPEGAQMAECLDDVVLWALPVFLALPWLFLGCVGTLVFRPAARTGAACWTFGAALAFGAAALCALVA